jgi:thiosulfate dehydrogenase [quinone] large subunit
MIKRENYSRSQLFCLVTLRVVIGWHFLYEGVVKILNPNWSAQHFLMDSDGWFAPIFESIANSSALPIVNYLNIIGLVLVGLGLMTGLLSKYASIGGILLLSMYFLSHPPFVGADYIMPSEGSYLWIDRNIVEIFALLVLIYFPTSKIIGLDRFFNRKKS